MFAGCVVGLLIGIAERFARLHQDVEATKIAHRLAQFAQPHGGGRETAFVTCVRNFLIEHSDVDVGAGFHRAIVGRQRAGNDL